MSLIEQFQFNFLDDSRWQFIVSGLKNTIIITFFAVLLGVFLGFLIAIVRSTDHSQVNSADHIKDLKFPRLIMCGTDNGTAADRLLCYFCYRRSG